ncbi:MAG: hypothetical protein RR914_00905 [Oscillospiraceae bacterium]
MDNISDLLSSISPEELSKLKSVAEGIIGGNSGETESKKAEGGDPLSSLFGEGVSSNLVSVMSKLNKEDDKTRFLHALKPLLSEDRRKKADDAIKFLKLMEMLPLLKEMF